MAGLIGADLFCELADAKHVNITAMLTALQ
jgi:hypothetical protein